MLMHEFFGKIASPVFLFEEYPSLFVFYELLGCKSFKTMRDAFRPGLRVWSMPVKSNIKRG